MVNALLCLALAQSPVPPLTEQNSFPFVIPWDDALKGTATDVSFLNAKPAGKNGRILVRNGHFVEEKTGKRIRFFATNAVAEAAFPTKADADKVAAHMAKLGINLVRFHHMNNGWATETRGNLWKRGRTHLEIDPAQLDRMDYFVAALKRNGIYVNMNLQVSREYLPELGLPESVRQIPSFQKKVDKFNARMIELQKEFAKDLLDRKNPYTGLRYQDEPALAKIEINNENSLVGWPGESAGAGLNSLPEPFLGDLKSKWVAHLKRTYRTTEGLRQAWAAGNGQLGPSLVNQRSVWTHENQSNGNVTFTPGASSGDRAPKLTVDVVSNPGPVWHVQAHLAGLTLEDNKLYALTFRARADRKTSVGVDARINQPDWHSIGLSASAPLTTEWQDYAFTFRTSGTVTGHCRVGFILGDTRGKVEITDLQLRAGVVATGLPDGQTLEAGNIDFPTPSVSPRFRDWANFLAQMEQAYSEEMRRYLQEDLKFTRANIIDSQRAWGGLTSLFRERKMEFADNHAYWNHPVFLGSDWDPKNYRVSRSALVSGLPGNTGTLGSLALDRQEKVPYSVSEYNHPAPSDYQIEMMPLLASFAAFQDWDAIYTFDYGVTRSGQPNDLYNNYFEVARNPAKAAFFPASALIFRLGLVPPAPARRTLVAAGPRPWEPAFTPGEAWGQLGVKPNPLAERVSVMWSTQGSLRQESVASRQKPALRVVGQAYVAESDRSVSITGFVGGKKLTTSVGTFTVGKLPTQFASLMLATLDGKPVRTSGRVLMTAGSRVENTGMAWNEARDSVSDQWGRGPVRAEKVPVMVTLKVDGPRVVYALDPRGRRRVKVPATVAKGILRFRASDSMWWEIARS